MHLKTYLTVAFLFLSLPVFCRHSRTLLFIGSYTDDKPAEGVYVYEFDETTGSVKKLYEGQDIINPSYITIAPGGSYLYACTETKMPPPGSVTAFTIDSVSGKLSVINKQTSGGANPVYLSVHKDGKWVVVGNYTGGSVSTLPINNNGSLGTGTQLIKFSGHSIDTVRQEKPHIHSAVFSPDYSHVFLPDLGTDHIRSFGFDATKPQPLIQLEDENVHALPGSGPRHFTFHPNGKYAYCIEELSGTISFYSYNNGKLQFRQRISSYAAKHPNYGSADIHTSPDGKFLYASNRAFENNIAIFSVDQQTGMLTLVGHQPTGGDHPRNFTISPDGNYLLAANMLSNNIIIFKRDVKTGRLTQTKYSIKIHAPSCLQMRVYGVKK